MPAEVLLAENYRRLVDPLSDQVAAKVLRHADQIDDTAVRVLADLPQSLCHLAVAVPGWQRRLDGLAASLQFLVSRGVASSVDALVAELASITSQWKLGAVMGSWVGSLPLPEAMPPASFAKARRLDEGAEVCSLARRWRNCLADYTSGIDIGVCATYLWDDHDRPAACSVRRHGRLGWFLDEVKGPGNATVEAGQLESITAAFTAVGVLSSETVLAIERIIYGDSSGLASAPVDD